MPQPTTSGPQQQLNMPAVDLRQMFATVVASAGVRLAGDFFVGQRGAGANMSVDVNPGGCAVADGAVSGGGFYGFTLAATANVAVAASDPSLNRIDRIVVQIRDHDAGAPTNDASVTCLTGVATAGATLTNCAGAAAVPANCLLLANVNVTAGSTTVPNANIDNNGASNNSPPVRPLLAAVTQTTPQRFLYTVQRKTGSQKVSDVASKAWAGQVVAPYSFTVGSVIFNVSVQSGNWDVGIYDANLNRLWSLGATAVPAPSTGVAVLISAGSPATLTLGPGTYYLALVFDNVVAKTVYLGGAGVNDVPAAFVYSKTACYPLPSSLAGATDESNNASNRGAPYGALSR